MSLKLYAGSVELGTLTVDDIQWPRTYYHFAAAPGYESVRAFYETHLGADEGRITDFETFLDQSRALDLRLVDEESETTLFMDVVFIVAGSEALIRQGFLRRIDEKGVVKWVRHDDSMEAPPFED
jgi:hypothetical protein